MYREPAKIDDDDLVDLSDVRDNEQMGAQRVMYATVIHLCERAAREGATVEEIGPLLYAARNLYNCAAHQPEDDE